MMVGMPSVSESIRTTTGDAPSERTALVVAGADFSHLLAAPSLVTPRDLSVL